MPAGKKWEDVKTADHRALILSSLFDFHPGDLASVSAIISFIIILVVPLGDYVSVLNEQHYIINIEKLPFSVLFLLQGRSVYFRIVAV